MCCNFQEGRKTGINTQAQCSVDGSIPNGTAVTDEEDDDRENSLRRTGRLFGGLIMDVKRKAPFYLSDFKDVLHVQCIASFFFMYFACLTPIITFGGLLGSATNDNMVGSTLTYRQISNIRRTLVGN